MDGRVKRKSFADLMAEAALQGMPEDKTTADLLNIPLSRGAILPLTEYLDRAEFDLSSGLPGAFADAVTAPARAARGEISEAEQIPEAFNFAGSLTLGSLLAPRPTGSVGMGGRAAKALEAQQPQGIRAFHGSPHNYKAERLIEWPDGRTEYIEGMPDVLPDVPQGARAIKDFPLGRQRLDKIGTGEGAQAYGHGLYEAGAEDVARSYRDTLTKSGQDWGQRALDKAGGDVDAAISNIQSKIEKYRSGGADSLASSQEEILRALNQYKETGSFSPGHMYEVNIRADPESFIDYDRPLGQQSEAVRRALDEAGLMPYTVVDQAGNRLDFSKGMPKAEAERFAAAKGGRAIPKDDADFDAVRKAQMMTGRGDAAQADIATALREAGIPGVRYLDQMSRGAGEGSSNYVIFDDAIIDIVRKYGIAGLALLQAAGYGTNEGEETQ